MFRSGVYRIIVKRSRYVSRVGPIVEAVYRTLAITNDHESSAEPWFVGTPVDLLDLASIVRSLAGPGPISLAGNSSGRIDDHGYRRTVRTILDLRWGLPSCVRSSVSGPRRPFERSDHRHNFFWNSRLRLARQSCHSGALPIDNGFDRPNRSSTR